MKLNSTLARLQPNTLYTEGVPNQVATKEHTLAKTPDKKIHVLIKPPSDLLCRSYSVGVHQNSMLVLVNLFFDSPRMSWKFRTLYVER